MSIVNRCVRWLRPSAVACGWLIALAAGTFAPGCARNEPSASGGADSLASARTAGATTRTFVFECEGLEFEVRANKDTAWVFLPNRGVALPHVPSGSGARYEAGGVLFWSQGDEALLEVDGRTYRSCRNNPAKAVWADAKLRGVDFRATGNEPGWMLEIDDGIRIDLVKDYGESSVHTPAPTPVVDRSTGRTTYHAVTEEHDLRITIEAKPCQDSMSGAEFASTVTVLIDGTTYTGCGRALH